MIDLESLNAEIALLEKRKRSAALGMAISNAISGLALLSISILPHRAPMHTRLVFVLLSLCCFAISIFAYRKRK